MNLKNLFKTGILLLFVTLFAGALNAQTYYVSNSGGSDGYNGLFPTWTSGNDGPKLTLGAAIAAAPGGNIISVAFTGVAYTEGPTITINKALTLTSTGGTPVFTAASLVVNIAGGTTFTGPFQFVDLTLTAGAVTGAANLTLSGNITRTAGSVVGQLNYTAGAHNFTYDGGVPIVAGSELPAAGNLVSFGDLRTTGAGTALTLSKNNQMNGVLNTAGTLNLGGFTLTISGASLLHANAGAISTGTLAFSMSGNTTLTAGVAGSTLPTVTATSTAGTPLLTLATMNAALSLTASGAASITSASIATLNVALNTSNVLVNSGTGIVTMSALTTVNGNILINPTVTSTLNQGQLLITTAAGVTVNGNVTNNTTVTLSLAAPGGAIATGSGLIRFPDQILNITGNVVNSSRFEGAVTIATNFAFYGNIVFLNAATAVTINGSVQNSSNTTLSSALAIIAFADNGCILFSALTSGIVRVDGGVSNTSNFSGFTHANPARNGNINFDYGAVRATPSTIGVNVAGQRVGAVTNSSSASAFGRSGNIIFMDPTNAVLTSLGFYGTSVNISGTVGGGTYFGNEIFNVTGNVTNQRTSAAGVVDLFIGAGAGLAARPVIISGALSNTSTSSTSILVSTTAAVTLGSLQNSGSGTISFTNLTTANVVITGALQNSSSGTISFTALTTGNVSVGGALTSSGALGTITFAALTTGNVTASGALTVSAGSVSFPAITTGALTFTGVNVSGTGTVNVNTLNSAAITINGAFTVSGGTVNFLGTAAGPVNVVQSNINWTAGAINFGARIAVNVTGSNNTIGGATTNPTFTSTTAVLTFGAPIPGVTQTINIGAASPVYTGPFLINNAANIPSPVVQFLGGNLRVSNNVTFTTAAVNNSILLNGARIYVGLKNPAGTAGDFTNNNGYYTQNGGRVVMYGGAAAAQIVNSGAAPVTFGDFEVDNNSTVAAPAVTYFSPCTFTGAFYLSAGSSGGANVIFNAPAPYPTIYRSEGSFFAAPTFNSLVNVTEIGLDKATALEIPAAADRLNDLTIATTNGALAGFGIVTMTGAATVNGILTINANQSLYTGANVLTLNGASAIVNGYLVDDATTRVQLNGAAGIIFTGTGWLPSLQVNAGSAGNTVSGRGLISNGFGGDGVWGGGNDDFTTMDGNITYAGGVASSLTATFSAPVAPSTTNFLNLTTAVGATFTLGASAIMGGNINHVAGTIALVTFNLTNLGTAPGMTGGALFTSGTGSLIFPTAATILTVGTSAATIGANVAFRGATATFITNNLTVNGTLTLGVASPASATAFTIPNTLTLTAGGPSVTLNSTSSFLAAGAPSTGILQLVNTAPSTLLTFNTPVAGQTVANLTVGGNVTFSGANLLTVNGIGSGFVMNTGTLTIGNANLVIGAAGVTPFVYNGGTIVGTSFLVWNSTSTWTQAAALTLSNLEVDLALDITNANANAITSTLTINTSLYLNGAVLTHARTVAPTGSLLTIAALSQIRVDGTGNLAASVPNFGGLVNYLFRGATSTPNAFTWPTAQANNVTISMAAAGNTVTTGASKSIAGNLTETVGQLSVSASTTFTVATVGATVTVDRNGGTAAINLLGAGVTLAVFTGPDVHLVYTGAAGAYNSGPEYAGPTIVRNLTIGVSPGPSATNVTLVTARTIQGTLTMFSTLTINANTTWSLAQTIAAASTVTLNAGFTSTWNLGLTVNGTYNDIAAVLPAVTVTSIPAGGLTVGIAGAVTIAGTLNNTGGLTVNTPGTFTNNGIVNADGLTATGPITLGNGSTTTFTGGATFAGFTPPAFVAGGLAEAGATISTNSNLTFGAVAWTGIGNLLNLTFTGTNAQTVALGANRQINNLNMTKGSNQTVTFSGGNLTLNPVQDAGIQPAGFLTLTRGVLSLTAPATVTLNPTYLGAFVNTYGFVRNPANTTDLAHVFGSVGMPLLGGTQGRIEWPVGTASSYRPVAVTFLATSPVTTGTTISVSANDINPGGTAGFPLTYAGVTVDTTAGFAWQITSSTSLGPSQTFDIEFQGTGFPVADYPNGNVTDIRVLSRLGNVVTNPWAVQGGIYLNFEAVAGLPIVRVTNSTGNLISQSATFTFGFKKPTPPVVTYNISGSVLYANVAVNPIANVNLTLTPTTGTPLTTTSDAAGNFTFANVLAGTYTLTASKTGNWGGVNSTDALLVSQFFAGLQTFTTLQQAAADVNNNALINNTDALQIVQRWAGIITSFAKGDWVFDSRTVTVASVNLTGQNINGLAVGDVNASYTPPTGTVFPKPEPIGVVLEPAKVQNVNAFEKFDIPVRVSSNMTLGAVSLRFSYPADMASFEGATSTLPGLVSKADGGVISIGWVDMGGKNEGVRLEADDVLVTLKFAAKTDKGLIAIETAAGSEFADMNGNVLSIAGLTAAMVKIGAVPSVFELAQNYPNPFNPSTEIEYSLPKAGIVTLTIFNIIGQEVARLVDGVQEAGVYKVQWNASELTSGIYYYILNVEGGDKKFTKTQKMMLLK